VTNRRAFLLGAAALGTSIATTAQPVPARRVAWVSYSPPGVSLDAFTEGLRDLGYSGKNAIGIEVRVVEADPDRVRAVLDELTAMRVSLIVCQAAVAPVLHKINAGRVPLVFAFSGDPVIAGMAESFGRPGGNTTGVSFLALELVGKRLEVLREISPSVRRVAILANPQHPGEKAEMRASLEAADRVGVQSAYVQILPGEDPGTAFERIRSERVQGIIVFQDAGMVTRATRIAEFAIKERLPVVSGWAQFAEAGFLATYGPNLNDAFRHLADYVDRILKGARAGTLPVELPTRVELAVNLATAKALGLAVPQSILLRADRIIQ
jgi:putative ABC transport system substrate-binding protein